MAGSPDRSCRQIFQPLVLPLASGGDSAAFAARIPRTSRLPSLRRATNASLLWPSGLAFPYSQEPTALADTPTSLASFQALLQREEPRLAGELEQQVLYWDKPAVIPGYRLARGLQSVAQQTGHVPVLNNA
jgi:hypothetical protein